MIRFAIAMLMGSVLIATSAFAQQTAPSSETPSNSQSQVPSGQDDQPLRVCSAKNPPPCATPPRVIKSPDPKYSKEGRKKNMEGTTVLFLIVGADGLPRDIRYARTVGHGLDEEAIKAVKKWRFKPGTMDGKPVAVRINVEVNFRLH